MKRKDRPLRKNCASIREKPSRQISRNSLDYYFLCYLLILWIYIEFCKYYFQERIVQVAKLFEIYILES